MRKLFNGLKICSIVISCLVEIIALFCLVDECWDGIYLYVMLLQALFLLTLINNNAPFRYKLTLTIFNALLILRNIYFVEEMNLDYLIIWSLFTVQALGLWVKYKKK